MTQTVISENSRGDVRPIWELLYNHYGVLKKLNATWTKQYRDMVVEKGEGAEGGGGYYGSTSGGFDQLGYGTLLYSLLSSVLVLLGFGHRAGMSSAGGFHAGRYLL